MNSDAEGGELGLCLAQFHPGELIFDEEIEGVGLRVEGLPGIVTRILVHEIGHHFGLSDGDMARIEAEPD